MKAVKTIPLPPAMQGAFIDKVFAALGQENALFVGGCVRNALLGEEVNDIDLATLHKPKTTIKALESAGLKAIPTGIEHGTITAVSEGQSIEITTLRKDIETDGRRALVAFTDDWRHDAMRRDFTMNTLLADQSGNIFDPLGQGMADLNSRRVVFVGNPDARIAEDHLRILRFFRFHALYGGGEPDKAALEACKAGADKIISLSKERITQEIFKILSFENPVSGLQMMFECGVVPDLAGAQYDPKILSALCHFESRFGLASISSRLLVLSGFEGAGARGLSKYLLIPKVFQRDMKSITAVLDMQDLNQPHPVKVAVYKQGRTPTAYALMIELATDRVNAVQAKSALDIIQNWDVPDFPVSGQDLLIKGFKPGPDLGAELERLESQWIENGFKN